LVSRLKIGNSVSICRAMVLISARAWSSVTLAFNRATGKMPGCHPRSSGSVAAHGPSGT
jgi:hypothetical protein